MRAGGRRSRCSQCGIHLATIAQLCASLSWRRTDFSLAWPCRADVVRAGASSSASSGEFSWAVSAREAARHPRDAPRTRPTLREAFPAVEPRKLHHGRHHRLGVARHLFRESRCDTASSIFITRVGCSLRIQRTNSSRTCSRTHPAANSAAPLPAGERTFATHEQFANTPCSTTHLPKSPKRMPVRVLRLNPRSGTLPALVPAPRAAVAPA